MMRRLLVPALLAIVATAILGASQVAFLAPPSFNGEGSSFRYTGQGQRNGSLYVNVSFDMDDPEAIQKHVLVNNERAQQLTDSNGPIPVVVTFADPMSQVDAIALGHEAGLEVESFLTVGRSPISGKRGTHLEFAPLDKDIPIEVNLSRGEQQEKINLQGVMLVKGRVASRTGLIKLISDPRVYLADISEFEVRRLIAQRHAATSAGKEISVAVESPYWELDW